MSNLDRVLFALFSVLGLFIGWITFVILPVAMYADAECLRAGYPKASVTFGLERYCLTLDGAVAVKVTKQ